MDLISDQYLDGGIYYNFYLHISPGVVSKALTWSSQHYPPVIDKRVAKPFKVNRVGSKNTSFTLPLFHLDPKDVQTSRIVDCADSEVQTVDVPTYDKPIHNLSVKPVRVKQETREHSSNSISYSPASVVVPNSDEYMEASQPSRMLAMGIIDRDLSVQNEFEPVLSFKQDIVPLKDFKLKKKFRLPSVFTKSDTYDVSKIVLMQARWRGRACRRKLRLAQTVNSIFPTHSYS